MDAASLPPRKTWPASPMWPGVICLCHGSLGTPNRTEAQWPRPGLPMRMRGARLPLPALGAAKPQRNTANCAFPLAPGPWPLSSSLAWSGRWRQKYTKFWWPSSTAHIGAPPRTNTTTQAANWPCLLAALGQFQHNKKCKKQYILII